MTELYFHASQKLFKTPKIRKEWKDTEDHYNRVLGFWSSNRIDGLQSYGNNLYQFQICQNAKIIKVKPNHIANTQPLGYWFGLRDGWLDGGIQVVRAGHLQVVLDKTCIKNFALVSTLPKQFYDPLEPD